MSVGITVENVSKRFRRGERHNSLRDLVGSWLRFGPSMGEGGRAHEDDFWALDNVSFDVKPGEAFGLIGPNGAGKSTMLKLLAGIMRPNRGQIKIDGRISALIEVGAGFHPDLTGRENVYLNAAILGMEREEVDRKFDEIVDFAGIGDFLDTPIKRYSSGMYARLGFSVAAHVEPDVLLVDEVLSVGDRVFRTKCLEKMRGFLERGVAVVFVSHDLRAVSAFCDRALVLANGKPVFHGPVTEAVSRYHKACLNSYTSDGADEGGLVDVEPIRFMDASGREKQTFTPGESVTVEFDVKFLHPMVRPSFGLSLIRAEDRMVVFETSSTRMNHVTPPAVEGTRCRVKYDIKLNVQPAEYVVGYHVRDRDSSMYAALEEDARIMVIGGNSCGGVVDLAPHVSVKSLESAPPQSWSKDAGRLVAS